MKEDELMKKIITLLLIALFTVNAFTFASSANAGNGKNWYVARSGNKRPSLPYDHAIVEQYDAYYIDKGVTDTSDKKILYLTFDAGYENGNVESVLNTLKEKNVPGAFFLLDNIIIKNTQLVKRMSDEGHTVCNHTKNHKDLSGLSKEQIVKNITDLEKIYEQKCGKQMSKYFRFPEGRYSEEALKTVCEMGYKTIFWSFGYADWDNAKQMSPEKAKKKILENTHNGAVILLHPTSKTNAVILPELIDEWRAMGYSFGTMDQLVENCK